MALRNKLLAIVMAAIPLAGVAQVLAEPQKHGGDAMRVQPPDWDNKVADYTADWMKVSRFDWLKAGKGKYRVVPQAYDDDKQVPVYRVMLVVDFDNSIYWNMKPVPARDLVQKLKDATRSGALTPEDSHGVAVQTHQLAKRSRIYELIWALNDAGLTPDIVFVKPPKLPSSPQ